MILPPYPLRLLHPQNRLANGVIANHLGNRWIGIEPLPYFEITWVPESEAGKKQAGLAYRKIVEVLNIVTIRPRILVHKIRNHEPKAARETLFIRKLICPQIAGCIRKNMCTHAQ